MNGYFSFVAIDFETADIWRDSACAVAMVRVDDGRITKRVSRLIRPPRQIFTFTYLHGISWADVFDEPSFDEVWSDLEYILVGVDTFVAHNASFDRSVLNTCAHAAGLKPPGLPFKCTVKLARRVWGLHPATLPDVCRYLGIRLKHHCAESDAEACARIMIAIMDDLGLSGKGSSCTGSHAVPGQS